MFDYEAKIGFDFSLNSMLVLITYAAKETQIHFRNLYTDNVKDFY